MFLKNGMTLDKNGTASDRYIKPYSQFSRLLPSEDDEGAMAIKFPINAI